MLEEKPSVIKREQKQIRQEVAEAPKDAIPPFGTNSSRPIWLSDLQRFLKTRCI